MLHTFWFKCALRHTKLCNSHRLYATISALPGSYTFPTLSRSYLDKALYNFLLTPPEVTHHAYPLVWLIGPEGCGKKWAVHSMTRKIRELNFKQLLFLEYDFEKERTSNLQILVSNFLGSLRRQLCDQWILVGYSSEWIFNTLQINFPGFPVQVQRFIELVVSKNSFSSLQIDNKPIVSLKALWKIYKEKSFDKDGWLTLLQIFQKECPLFCKFIGSSELINIALFVALYASTLNDTSKFISKMDPHDMDSGLNQRGISYMLCLVEAIRKELSLETRVFLSSVEIFHRSTYLQVDGPSFLHSLLYKLLPQYSVPHLLGTSDSLLLMKMAIFNKMQAEMAPPTRDKNEMKHSVDPIPFEKSIIQVYDLPKDLAFVPFEPLLTKPELFHGFWKSIGGNVGLIKKVANQLSIHNYQMDLELQKFKRIENGVDALMGHYGLDAAEYDTRPTLNDLLEAQKFQKQREFLGNLAGAALKKEMAQFEWKMDRFFSLQSIEALRSKTDNQFVFYVTVYETIRLILKMSPIYCYDFNNLQHPVILGLLDMNLLTAYFTPPRLVVTNAFIECLLKSYIGIFYASLSWTDKLKYNAVSLTNNSAFKSCLSNLASQ